MTCTRLLLVRLAGSILRTLVLNVASAWPGKVQVRSAIIFTATRKGCELLSETLEELGHTCTALHSGKTQQARASLVACEVMREGYCVQLVLRLLSRQLCTVVVPPGGLPAERLFLSQDF